MLFLNGSCFFPSWARLLVACGRQYRGRVFAGIGCNVVARVCDLMPLALVGFVMNDIAEGGATAQAFAGYGAAVFFCFAGLALFQSGSDYLLATIAQSIRHDLRMQLFNRILASDAAFLETRRKGDLLSVLTNDVDVLNGFFSETIANAARVLISFAGTYGYLFWLDLRLALILVFPLPLIALAMGLFSRNIQPQYLRSRRAVGAFAGVLENSLQGVSTLQAYCAQEQEASRLARESIRYRDAAVAAAKTRRNFIPLVYCIAGLSFGLLIGAGGWLTRMPDGPSIGAYTSFVLMGMRLVVPIFTLTFLINQLQQAKAATRRIEEVLAVEPVLCDKPFAKELTAQPTSLVFENIRFGYPGAGTLFSDLSFSIQKGEFIGIAGPTGAGKSSIIKLLLRFYAPDEGAVRINGEELGEIAVGSFRQHVGYVSQHPFLFRGTVWDNLCIGMPHASVEAVEEAVRLAGVEEVITALPQGYHTVIGDHGDTLSGGQKQRLSLARALLRKPDVLILDEATSAVDGVTETMIQNHILKLRTNRIIIAIAHRLSTLMACDRIFVMDQGGIVQEGSHGDLVTEDGVYRSLWRALQV